MLIGVLLHCAAAFANLPPRAYTVTVSWDPSADPGIVAYRVYFGRASGEYADSVEAGAVTSARLPGLTGGVRYYFAVTAVHLSGEESEYSDEISLVPGPRMIRIAAGANGIPILTVQGVPGQFFDIEASDDLIIWKVIATVQIEANGSVEFSDAQAIQVPEHYYRTRLID